MKSDDSGFETAEDIPSWQYQRAKAWEDAVTNVTIPNGVYVHRMWGDLPDTELMAVFQYDTAACEWASLAIVKENKSSKFIITNTYDGKQWVVGHPSPTQTGGR